MTEINAQISDERPVFAAELTPYRSLGRTGFRVVLALCGVVCLFYGIFLL